MGSANLGAEVEGCIDAIYSSLTDPAMMATAVDRMRAAVGAATANFFILAPSGTPVTFTAANHDPEVVDRWMRYYSYSDPFREPCQAAVPGTWVTDDSLLDPVRSPQQEYVNDFARGAGLRWLTSGKLLESPLGTAFFSVQRPATMHSFDSETLSILDTLYPHLNRVSRLMLTLDKPLAAMAAARHGLDLLSVAAGALDVDGNMLYANRAMEALRQDPRVFQARGRRLEFVATEANTLLRRMIARIGSGVATRTRAAHRLEPGSIRIAVDGVASLLVKIVPLAEGAVPPATGTRPATTMVFITRSPEALETLQLQQTFGFTPAECEIMKLLAAGHNADDCASARQVTITTVRSQIASMLRKAGVGTQSQLLGLALSMPRTLRRG